MKKWTYISILFFMLFLHKQSIFAANIFQEIQRIVDNNQSIEKINIV